MNFVTETRPLEFRALQKTHVWPMCPVYGRFVGAEEKSLFPSLKPPPLGYVWKIHQILR